MRLALQNGSDVFNCQFYQMEIFKQENYRCLIANTTLPSEPVLNIETEPLFSIHCVLLPLLLWQLSQTQLFKCRTKIDID